MKKMVRIFCMVCFIILAAACMPGNVSAASVPTVKYQAHVQDIGWMETVESGGTAGTTGQGKRLEALTVTLAKKGRSMVSYRAHVSGIGWMDWMSSGETTGTTGQGKAIEAVQIKLKGAYASKYDIYYRMHVSKRGWLGWAKNGKTAGSTGMALQAEAIEIRLVRKGSSFDAGGRASLAKPKLTYQANVQSLGWQNKVTEGITAGTTGRALRLEAAKLYLKDFDGGNGIRYSAHVSAIGWQNPVNGGQLMGTTGQAKAIEAVRIQLSDSLADYFDIYYRIHSAEIGWLGWAANGETAGTTGGGLRAEALEIRIVTKGAGFDRGGAAYIDRSVQSAMWFMNNLYITQGPDDAYSHKGTQNFDVIGAGNNNIFAPFDCRVVAIYSSFNSGNTVVIESTKQVLYADGSEDFMSMCFAHDNDIRDLYVGKTIRQGEIFYQTGNYGNAQGNHSHVTCIRGQYRGDMFTQNAYGNWCSPEAISPEKALFISAGTNVMQTAGLAFARR